MQPIGIAPIAEDTKGPEQLVSFSCSESSLTANLRCLDDARSNWTIHIQV